MNRGGMGLGARMLRWALTLVFSRILWRLVKLAGRWFAGKPLEGGKPRTNSTFWHRATQNTEDVQRPFFTTVFKEPTAWAWAPGRTRAAVRWAVTAFPVAYVAGPSWMVWPFAAAVGLGLGLAGGWAVRLYRTREWRRKTLDPIAAGCASVLGARSAEVYTSSSDWITVPTNYRDEGASIRVRLPDGFVGREGTTQEIRHVVAARLPGVSESDLAARTVYEDGGAALRLRRLPSMPDACSPRDLFVQEVMAGLPEGTVMLGLRRGGRPVTANLDTDSPHVMVGAGTGGGKSVTVGGICAQLIRQGAGVRVLDTKVSSHPWAHGAGVPYADTTSEIHDALVSAGEEMQARNDRLRGVSELEAASITRSFQRQVIVIEEINTLMTRLKTYWQETRSKEDPKTSPAITALVEMANMGRTVKCHLIFCGQRLSVTGLGGSAEAGAQIRANAGVRIVARYGKSMWSMVIDDKAYRTAPGKPGRGYTLVGGKLVLTQMTFWDGTDTSEWALGGSPTGALPVVADEWPESNESETADAPDEAEVETAAEPAETAGPEGATQPLPVTQTQPVALRVPPKPSGLPAPAARPAPSMLEPAPESSETSPVVEDVLEARDSAENETGDAASEGEPVTLSMWVRARDFGETPEKGLAIVKSARKRAPGFPKPVGEGERRAALFAPADLDAWARNRESGETIGEAS